MSLKNLKKYGVRLANEFIELPRFIPESYALRYVTGGGFILGGYYILTGDAGIGKTSICLKLMAERARDFNQSAIDAGVDPEEIEGYGLYIDNEGAVDSILKGREDLFGLDPEKVYQTASPLSLEKTGDLINECIRDPNCHTIILDSMKASMPEKILDEKHSLEKDGMGAIGQSARTWNNIFGKWNSSRSSLEPKQRPLIILIDQLRVDVAGYYPMDKPTSGGRAALYNAHSYLKITKNKDTDYRYVQNIVKSRGAPANRKAEFGFEPIGGFDYSIELFEIAKESGALMQGGPFYSLEVDGEIIKLQGKNKVQERIVEDVKYKEALIKAIYG